MFCTNCGARNDATAVFCTNCGQHLSGSSNTAIRSDAQQANAQMPGEAVPAPASAAAANAKRRSSTVWWAIVIALGVVIVALAAYFILGATAFSPTKVAQEYMDDISAGKYTQASALSQNYGSAAQRQLLTNAFNSGKRMKNPQIVSSSHNADGSYTVKASYSVDGQHRSKNFTIVADGRQGLLWSGWKVSSPLADKLSLSVPTDVTAVSVDGRRVKLDSALQTQSTDESTTYSLLAYPGTYTISVEGMGNKTVTSGGAAVRFSKAAEKTDAPASTAKSFNVGQLNAIVNSYSSSSAAAAVRLLDGNSAAVYGTDQSNARLVAAGFYTPLYMAARQSGNSSDISTATHMMQTMSNTDANALMQDGIDPTQWAQSNGYQNTVFNRGFGDTEANSFKDSSWENWTSASDASGILADLYRAGGTGLMRVNIAGEGISVPAGMNVNAHRGFIGDAYCIYAIVQVGNKHAAVAVMSQGLNNGADYSRPKQMVSKILDNVNQQLK